nr:MAG TPA: hypothetical protein [Caudoviricetes sp.]
MLYKVISVTAQSVNQPFSKFACFFNLKSVLNCLFNANNSLHLSRLL